MVRPTHTEEQTAKSKADTEPRTEQHLIVKRLRQSELGWFEACREAGRETGRQRALNIDADLVTTIFTPAPRQDLIELRERWWDGERFVTGQRPLRLQQKNWRLAGEVVRGTRFDGVAPDDLVLLYIERDTPSAPWNLVWDIVSQTNSHTWSVFEMARRCIGGESSVLAPEDVRPQLLAAARRRLFSFGGDPFADTADLSDAEWETTVAWLRTHLTIQKLRALLRSSLPEDTRLVLQALGAADRDDSGALADAVLRRYGTELLGDYERRKLLANSRFTIPQDRPPPVERWQRGGPTAVRFAQALGLPACMGGIAVSKAESFEDVDAFRPLGALHEYQKDIAQGMHEVLRATQWEKRRAIAWLPTGTGKTRVTVETALLQCVLEAPRNCILWIADREELCEQAVETFRHVWMVRGLESRVARGGTVPPLRIIRLWGNRDWQEPPAHPTVIVASIQTLATRLKGDASGAFAEELAILGERAAVVIFDEAHHVVAPSYAKVIDALGLGPRPNYLGRNQKTAPPLLGLTATPARRHDDETEVLSRRFGGTLLEPSARYRSLKGYQDEGFLSRVVYKSIPTDYDLELSRTEREQFDLFHSLPSSVLKRIGAVTTRTTRILRDLERRLAHFKAVLVFACSVDHAHMMAEVLSRRGHRAAALDGTTARPLRWRTIQRFREGALRVLVNCDLLTTGFDAPNVEAVVLARPVESPVLYAQMIGRGLRGPKNGGTEECHIFDYQDRFVELPDLNDLRERFRSNFLATSR